MKKSVGIIAGLLCTMLVLLCGCRYVPARPKDTNLEFWIKEDVTHMGYDWEGHHWIMGFGNYDIYYGTGYEPVISEWEGEMPPDECVSYYVRGFADGIDMKRYVVGIGISDPKIVLYGLTVNSTFEEFDEVFRGMGYRIKTEEGVRYPENEYAEHIAKRKGFSFSLGVAADSHRWISIAADYK